MDNEAARDSGFEPEVGHIGLEIAAAAVAALRSGGIPLLPNADNVVLLPAGTTLDDIRVEGRDLVVRLDDGRVFIIPDGAVFVPQIVIDGVSVPPLNLAALLIGQQPEPAAGAVNSSGGNFADPNAPIQSAFDLGNLLPYTELQFPQDAEEEFIPQVDYKPEVLIFTSENPLGSLAATSTVDEKGLPPHGALPAGSGEIADGNGANNSDTSETTTGSIRFVSLDGIGSITLNGTAITQVGQAINGASGTVTITSINLAGGVIGYSYSLTNSTLGDTTTDNFAVVVTDTDGDTAAGTLTIRIIDDVPTARPDTGSVVEGATVTGNVLPNDTPGADGLAAGGGVVGVRAAGNDTTTIVTTGVGTQIAGLYGTLTLNANGTYSYKSNPNTITADQKDVFVYTIRDGDTDPSTTTLTIDLRNVTLLADNQAKTVNEAALDTATTGADLGAGSVTGSNPASTAETATGQLAVTGATNYTPVTATGSYGLFKLNADGSYTYTLTKPFTTNPVADNGTQTVNGVETFAYTALDENGNSVAGSITINIVDDVPTARNDTDTVPNNATSESGNVITGLGTTSGSTGVDTLGADGAAVNGFRAGTSGNFANTGTTVTGQFGTLTLAANGGYTYTRNSNAPGGSLDVFSYRLADGDGDTSVATLTILIPDRPATVTSVPTTGGSTTVNEAGLPARGAEPEGTNQPANIETTSGTITFSTPDGFGSLSINGTTIAAGTVITTTKGTFTVVTFNPAAGTLTYSYTLIDNTNSNATSTDVFTVVVTDSDGDTDTKPFTITIIDDAPIARPDTDLIPEGSNGPATGNVMTGVGTTNAPGSADSQGADGAVVVGVAAGNTGVNLDSPGTIGAIIQGSFGKLTILNAQGDYTYTRDPNTQGGGEDVFTYTLKDGDGDLVNTTLRIGIGNAPPRITNLTPSANGGDVTVDEDDLPLGSDTSKEPLTQQGTFNISAPDGVDDLTVGTIAVIVNGVFQAGASAMTPLGNTLTFTGYNAGTGLVTYTYTLAAAETHPNGSGENDLFESFGVTLTDLDGQSDTDTLAVRIIDDVPTANDDIDDVTGAVPTATGNVITGTDILVGPDTNTTDGVADVKGADGAVISALVSVNVPANPDTDPGANFSVAGQYGTLTMQTNGDYSYTRTSASGGGLSEVFTYTLRDGDGDEDTATLTIRIADAVPSAGTVNATLDDDTRTNGIASGPNDDTPDTSNLSGTLPGSGGDPALTWALLPTGVVETGGATGFTYVPSGNNLLIQQNGNTVITITLNPANGAYTITHNANILHATLDGQQGDDTENNQIFEITYTVTDADGDPALPAGKLTINVDDDTPVGTSETGSVNEAAKDINAAFVLDFSDSIDNAELNTMLTAVKSAITQLDNSTGGATAFRFVLFSSSAISAGPFATAALANAYLDSINPTLSGTRPNTIGTQTDFTDAINLTMATYPADPTANNLVFFVSDGNPNEQTGTGGNSLADTTAAAWNTFVDNFNVNVTAIGVGGGITLPRLQDVDLNNAPNNVPILIADFTTLIAALTVPLAPTTISGDVDSNDSFGADGGRILSITIGAITYTWDGATTITASSGPAIPAGTSLTGIATPAGGTLSFDFANGAWTYTAPVSVAATTVETFTYNLVDNDGDKFAASLAITVNNDAAPTTAPVTATVDDDALSGGIAGGTGDLDANATESPVTLSEAIFSGTLGITYGADGAGTTTFAQLHGTSIAVGTESAALSWSGATNTLTATGPRGVLFTVQLTNPATGAYTVTLLDNVLHTAGGTENDALVALTYKVSDGNGTTATGVLNITFDDDTPTLGPVQNQQASNDPLQAPALGTLFFAPGADGAGAAMTITADMTGITFGGNAIKTEQSGNVLNGYYDANGSNTFDAGDTQVFALTVNPAGGTSGQYIFDLINPLDATVTPTPIGGSSSFGAGPTGYQVLQSATGQDLAVVSGYHMGGTFNEATWLSTGNAGPASNFTTAGVNGSTAGWGIDNNNFNGTDEMFVWDFGSQATRDPDGAGAFVPPTQGPDVLPNPPVEVQLPDISFATFDFVGYVTGDDIKYVVHFTDGTFASGTIPDANLNSGPDWTYTAPGGKFIADIEMFTSGAGQGKVDLVSVGVLSTNIDKTIPFTLVLNDGDADPTATANFTVRVATGLLPLAPALPIIFDLKGDGLQFQALTAGVLVDYLGNGQPLATAWVGKDDGILAIDLNGNGWIDSGKEFVFGGEGKTDLQALAAQYDSNHDGVLDAQDADFAKFGIWQDADSDGINDAGEFKSLSEIGITSIDLTSDGKTYGAAGGDVTVHGETTFTWSDGSTGVAADASFAVAGLAEATGGGSAAADTGDVMGSLLSLAAAAPASSDEGAQSLSDPASVLQAMGDSEASNFIDNLVNSLAGGGSGAQNDNDGSDTSDLAGLLGMAVGSGIDHAHLPFDMGQLGAPAEALAAG